MLPAGPDAAIAVVANSLSHNRPLGRDQGRFAGVYELGGDKNLSLPYRSGMPEARSPLSPGLWQPEGRRRIVGDQGQLPGLRHPD